MPFGRKPLVADQHLSIPERDLSAQPNVTIIIVNYNTVHLLNRMFSALRAAQGSLKIQTIVIDNASRDSSVEILRSQYPEILLIENKVNVGFGRANNQALSYANGDFILLLNTDAFMSYDTLVKTIEFMRNNSRCGILGAKLIGDDGKMQPSCRYFPTPWNTFLQSTGLKRYFPNTQLVDDVSWDHASVRECDWVPGCYYLIRREVISEVGLFDPRYFLYFEEVDHCFAARAAGWSVVYFPFTSVVHLGGESAKSEGSLNAQSRQISALQFESELLYFRKNFGFIGLLTHLILTSLSETVRIIKSYLPRADPKKRQVSSQNLATTFRLLMATNFATRPTR